MQNLTIKQFIAALRKAKDIDIAPFRFVIDGQDDEYVLKSMSQFGIMANVVITIEKAKSSAPFRPVVFQKSKRKAAASVARKIKKDFARG